MKNSKAVSRLVILLALGCLLPGMVLMAKKERALAIAQEVEHLAHSLDLWPGYEPLAIPLAIYTGEATYLFRHPELPEGFNAVEGESPYARYPGWRIVLEAAPGHPIWPQGFDPLKVQRVEGGILHTRYLKLDNESGACTAVDGEGGDFTALTEKAGDHPLFNGVTRVTLGGLERPFVEETEEGAVRFTAPAVEGRFQGVAVEWDGTTLYLRLAAPTPSP